jgi:hypothetical protein
LRNQSAPRLIAPAWKTPFNGDDSPVVAQVARDLIEIAAARHHDQPSAETWRDIADAIERL